MWDESEETAARMAEKIRRANHVLLVSHIDADGLSSAGIASVAMDRAGIEHTVRLIKQLDSETLSEVVAQKEEVGADLLWFCDLGSGHVNLLESLPCIVCDHHVPYEDEGGTPSFARSVHNPSYMDLMSFFEDMDKRIKRENGSVLHLNPFLYGDGPGEISGAGVAYLVVRHLINAHKDLAAFAVVGAVGDLQDRANGRLVGDNARILADAVSAGKIEVIKDLVFFGRETRTVIDFLRGAVEDKKWYSILKENVVPSEVSSRTWSELEEETRITIRSNLVRTLLFWGMPPERILGMFGEVYLLSEEVPGESLREAKEFATLLNACGRYGYFDTAMSIFKGDREKALKEAKENILDHRKNLKKAREYLKDKVVRGKWFDHFLSDDIVPDTVVGTLVGGILERDSCRPLIGVAEVDGKPDKYKVSARAPPSLVEKGLDLSAALGEAAEAVEGIGGGHRGAAGATIPRSRLEEFLEHLEETIRTQCEGGGKGNEG